MLGLALLLAVSYFLGKVLLAKQSRLYFNRVQLATFQTCLGYGVILFMVHMLGLITHNFHLSIYLVLAITTIFIAFKFPKEKLFSIKLTKNDYICLGLCLILSILILLRRYDVCTELVRSNLIFNPVFNDFYPPHLFSNQEQILNNYHYGSSIFFSLILFLSQLDPFSGIPLMYFLSSLSFFILLYTLLKILTPRFYLMSFVFSVFFTSINAVQYLYQTFVNPLEHSSFTEFLNKITEISLTTTESISQIFSLPLIIGNIYLFLGLITLIKFKYSNYFNLNIFICFFVTYYTFPAYWFPVFIAYVSVTLFQFLKINIAGNSLVSQKFNFLTVFIMISTKFLCFTEKETYVDGINNLLFKPDFNWVPYGTNYLFHFYPTEFIKSFPKVYDYVAQSHRMVAPLFSSISFREFGFIVLVALIIFVYRLMQKKAQVFSERKTVLLLISLIALCPMILFEFSYMPTEFYRFGYVVKLFAFFYIAANLKNFSSKKYSTKFVIFIGLLFLSICSVPGLYLYFQKGTHGQVLKANKKLFFDLRSFHKKGEKLLFNEESFNKDKNYSIPYLAGFFGFAGNLVIQDYISNKTALRLLSPKLLLELGVDKILINEKLDLNNYNLGRLKDPRLFEEVKGFRGKNNGYYLFKFKKQNLNFIAQFPQDYYWQVGLQRLEPRPEFEKLDTNIEQINAKHISKIAALKTLKYAESMMQSPGEATSIDVYALPRI